MSPRILPVLHYPGSKHRIARWIVAHFPAHSVYLEPFFGSGSTLYAKPLSPSEIINDLDGEVTNLFRVLRDHPEDLARAIALTPWSREEFEMSFSRQDTDPLETARRFVVYWWQGVGCRGITATGFCVDYTGAARPPRSVTWIDLPERLRVVARRLQGVQIENRPALDLIGRCRHEGVLIYADPPYPGSVRSGRLYAKEMLQDCLHESLIAALASHPGPVVLSGYDCALYREALSGWTPFHRPSTAQKPGGRTEWIWLNPQAARGISSRLPGTDEDLG